MAEPIRPISQAVVTDTVGITGGTSEQQQDALQSLAGASVTPVESDGLEEVTVASERDKGFSSVSNFLAQNQITGFAKANRFLVTFNFNSNLLIASNAAENPLGALSYEDVANLLTFKCEQAEFPGREFITSDARIYGPTYKSPTMSSYQDVNLTLICDNALTQRHIFEVWMSFINTPRSFDFNYRDSYICDVDIEHYNELNECTYISTLKEAYPLSVTSLSANWADDNIHKLQVTLTYRYFQSKIKQKSDIGRYNELKDAHVFKVQEAAAFPYDRSFFREDNREHQRKIARISDESRSRFREVVDSLNE